MATDIDEMDRAILAELQKDASLPIDALSERVHLSRNACWRRVKAMEASGVITGRVALVDAARVGCPLTAIVLIRTSEHAETWIKAFIGQL